MSALTEPVLLTPAQAAEYLGVATSTLANWRSAGIGPEFRKKNRIIRYEPKVIKSYLPAGPARTGSKPRNAS